MEQYPVGRLGRGIGMGAGMMGMGSIIDCPMFMIA